MIRIAVDGPAGAGKSSIAKRVAKDLKIIYVDTGAMYRSIGLYVRRKGLNTKEPEDVLPQLDKIDIKTQYDPSFGQRIFLNGEDVSEAIRSPEMSLAASDVSAIPEVRRFLTGLQKKMASQQSLIMDGRDIGTVVLPDADVKIFLTASPEARARRRYLEYLDKGQAADYDTILKEVILRDKQDCTRKEAPLRPAEDAVSLDTTNLDFEQSVQAIKTLIKERVHDVL